MPRRNPFSHPGNDPETRFDHWLDGLVSGTPDHDAARLDDPTGQLARAQSGARQLHGLAARPATVSAMLPARQRIEEQMMHNKALAAPDSDIRWNPPRRRQRTVAWWSLNSPVIAAALVFAVLISLSGALYWVQRPASPPPTESPGFAAASPAVPNDGELSCSTPGYRSVVFGDVDDDELAMIGESEAPIIMTEDDVTIPLADGGATTLPQTSRPIDGVPGAYISYEQNGVSTLTNTALGESWRFNSREVDVQRSPSSSVTSTSTTVIGPYVIAPADNDGFDWTILDARTGESITTSELLGGIFPWVMLPGRSAPNAQDTGYQAVQFIRASEYLIDAPPERVPEDKSQVTDRTLNNTLAVILPGSVGDAAMVDVSGISGDYANGSPPVVTFSNDHSLAAWRGWDDDGTRFGFFVADVDNLANPTTFVEIDTPPTSAPITFSPDDSTLYVVVNNTIRAITVAEGSSKALLGSEFGELRLLAINDDAGTVIFTMDDEVWLLDTGMETTSRLPELDEFDEVPFFALNGSGFATATRFVYEDRGSGIGSTLIQLTVNTATGVIARETREPVVQQSEVRIIGDSAVSEGKIVTIDGRGTLQIIDAPTGSSWTMEPPDIGADFWQPDTVATPGDLRSPLSTPSLTISPNGGCLLFNLSQEQWPGPPTTKGPIDLERVGTWIAPLEPDAEWTKLDMELVDWWAVPTEPETETLPAQDFPPPIATPEAASQAETALSCSSPGYVPIMYGEPDTTALTGLGSNALAVTHSDDAITITMPDGTAFELPPGDLRWSDGLAIVQLDDGSRTVLNPVNGQSWTFDAVTFDDYPADMSGPNQPFAQFGPYIAGPVADNGVNWKIIDTRTGESRETADILGANFPHAAEARTPYPRGVETNGVVTLRFVQLVSIEDLDTIQRPTYTNMGATLVIGGTLDNATFIDFTADQSRFGDKDALSPAVPQDTMFNDDRSQVAWKGWRSTGDGFGQFGLFIADVDDLEHPRILVEVTNPDTIEPVMFDPYSPSVMAFIDGELNAVDVDTGEATPANVAGLTFDNLRLINPEAGTLIFNAGTPEAPEAWLYNVLAEEAQRLPDLDPYMLMYPIDGWTYATAWTRPPVEPRDAIEGAKVALIDSRTGEIVSLTEEPPASLDATSPIRTGSDFRDGVRISSQANNTFLVQDTRTGRDWTLPLPDGLTSATNADPQISPGGNCLVLTVYSNETAGPVESYIAPLVPDAEWTKLDMELVDWWAVPTEPETETLPAQDFPSPIATPGALTASSDLLVIDPDATGDYIEQFDYVGKVEDDVFTVTQPTGEQVTFPDVESVEPNGVQGQAIIARTDSSRSVVDLITGETLFDIPASSLNEFRAGIYLFISSSGDNADWTMVDLHNGQSRPLSDILKLPSDQPLSPISFGLPDASASTVFMHFISPSVEVMANDPPSFLIAGSLDNVIVLEGYPPATQPIDQWPVISSDDTLAAWITAEPEHTIEIADSSSGDEVARFDADTLGPDPEIAGFIEDGQALVVTTSERVVLLSWEHGEPQNVSIAEGLNEASNPNLYAPTGSLYFREGGDLKRLLIASGDITNVLDNLSSTPVRFTRQNAPWLIANAGGNAALIDARSGEVVSQLHDVPANPSIGYSLSISINGSTVLQQHAGLQSEYQAWVISPLFPDGFVLTSPIDPRDVVPDRGFPVDFVLSPDARNILVGTNEDTGFNPRYIATLDPDLQWIELADNVGNAQWIPMPSHTPDDQLSGTSPVAVTPYDPAADPLAAQNISTPTTSPDAFEPEFQTRPDVSLTLWERPMPPFGIGQSLPVDTPLMAIDDPDATSTPNTLVDDKGQTMVNVRTQDGRTGWVREVDLVPIDQPAEPDMESPTSEPAPTSPAIAGLVPDNLVPIFEPGPIDALPDPTTGGFSEAGLIMPLRNGETFHDANGVGISQVGHTGIAIVEHADGSRISIDLNTGETLASLYPDSPHEQLFGTWQLTPDDDNMANWRIVDLRTGDQTTTSDLFGGDFDQPAIPLLIAIDLDHLETLLIRFADQRAGELQAATPHSLQDRNEGEVLETWISPLQPDPEWTSIDYYTVETWLYDPEDDA